MTKDGFIRELEECLQGEVPGSQLADSLAYYRTYIMDEVASGKSEEAVLEDLGSPRLIARSIIDAYGEPEHPTVNTEYVQEDGEEGDSETFVRHRRYGGEPTPVQRVTGILILAGVILVAVSLLQVMLPVLAVVLFIWFIYRLLS